MQIQQAVKSMMSTRDVATLIMRRFIKGEEGQDLIEYTLLLAFVCLASAAVFISSGTTLNAIWQTTNTVLSNANAAAS